MTKARRIVRSLAPALVLLVVAGCGTVSTSAADQVPALSTRLAGIDRSVAAHQYGNARTQLSALVSATQQARDAGALDPAAAERILAAAAGMYSSLPAETVTALPAPAPATPSAETTTTEKRPKHDKGNSEHGQHHGD